jgi:hypothetical protein
MTTITKTNAAEYTTPEQCNELTVSELRAVIKQHSFRSRLHLLKKHALTVVASEVASEMAEMHAEEEAESKERRELQLARDWERADLRLFAKALEEKLYDLLLVAEKSAKDYMKQMVKATEDGIADSVNWVKHNGQRLMEINEEIRAINRVRGFRSQKLDNKLGSDRQTISEMEKCLESASEWVVNKLERATPNTSCGTLYNAANDAELYGNQIECSLIRQIRKAFAHDVVADAGYDADGVQAYCSTDMLAYQLNTSRYQYGF